MGVSVLVVAALALTGSTAASATTRPETAAAPVRTQRGHPANLDDAKQDIRSYYGDHVDVSGEHRASPDSAWARQVAQVDARAQAYLEHRVRDRGGRRPAIVLDIDDTALSTYSYGAGNDFAFHDDTKTVQWALAEKLPVIPPTLALARWAHDHGIALFFVTGRPHSLANATLGNVRKAGYPAATDIFLSHVRARHPRTCTAPARAQPSSTSRARVPTSSRWGTTSSRTSATSRATWTAVTPRPPSSCRTRCTSPRSPHLGEQGPAGLRLRSYRGGLTATSTRRRAR